MNEPEPTLVHITDSPPLSAPRFRAEAASTLKELLAIARERGRQRSRQRGLRPSVTRFRLGPSGPDRGGTPAGPGDVT